MDAPSFSPFPKVKGENIPPSDEEKEQILWQARDLVLHSNNVSMQVTWARDVLLWVDIAQDAQARELKREGRDPKDRPPTPKTEHELRIDAINILEYLAQQDHPEATFLKGKWLEFGKFGYRENKREAYSLYKRAAENGNGRAEYRMGMLYENSNDIPNAIKHYMLGVQMGDSASHYRMGMMHLMGQHGYQRDFLQGLDLIQKAADTADEDAPQGAYVYGMLIARELPDINIPEHLLPYDLSVARQYIEKAAYLSFSKAQLKMGQAYELSQLGCDFNPAYSLHYYGLAARQGQPEAALGVSRWFLFGYEDLFPKNEQLAFKYAHEAALAGLATGEFAMGYYYEIGIHVAKDLREARRWYELAAEHGNKDAKERLESLNQSKTLTKKDHETTTLTRIKSQHGSQRGKRPDRFARQADVMPTVNEDAIPPGGMVHDQQQTREQRWLTLLAGIDFPDPTPRPPAFTLNIDGNLAARPKSAAPYPVDDQPQPPPLNVRSKSAAPYPDDMHGPPMNSGPHLTPGPGPHADRPGSAFGIRPLSNHGLQPGPGAGPGAGRGRPMSGQPPYPSNDRLPVDGRARLQKPNPNQPHPPHSPPASGPYYQQGPGGSPGREPRPNNQRPVSDMYGPAGGQDRFGAGPPPGGRLPNNSLRPPTSGGPPGRAPSAPPAAGPAPPSPGLRPSPIPGSPIPGAQASPGANPTAQKQPQPRPAAAASAGGKRPAPDLTHPDGKTFGQGPATFEEMGIPQGKSENDCVSFTPLDSLGSAEGY